MGAAARGSTYSAGTSKNGAKWRRQRNLIGFSGEVLQQFHEFGIVTQRLQFGVFLGFRRRVALPESFPQTSECLGESARQHVGDSLFIDKLIGVAIDGPCPPNELQCSP